MRPWFERQHLPLPGSIGDGLRTLAGAIAQPHLLLADRTMLYGQAAVFATRASQLGAELGGDVQRQADTAARAAHRAALEAARAVETGATTPAAGAAIATAAGPAHAALAQEQTRQLNQSLAANPGQGGYFGRTARELWAIPGNFLFVAGFMLVGLALAFRRMAARSGARNAVQASLGVLVAVPLAWLLPGRPARPDGLS